jgi:hypothetical protein
LVWEENRRGEGGTGLPRRTSAAKSPFVPLYERGRDLSCSMVALPFDKGEMEGISCF